VKVGLGLYAGKVTKENLRFARQLGVTRIVQHLPGEETLPSTAGDHWSLEDLRALVRHVESEGGDPKSE